MVQVFCHLGLQGPLDQRLDESIDPWGNAFLSTAIISLWDTAVSCGMTVYTNFPAFRHAGRMIVAGEWRGYRCSIQPRIRARPCSQACGRRIRLGNSHPGPCVFRADGVQTPCAAQLRHPKDGLG